MRCNVTTFMRKRTKSRAMEIFVSYPKIWEAKTFTNHHLLSKRKLWFCNVFSTFWKMKGGASIFLKQQVWNFLSSVFMRSLRRPAASIWTSWRLFIRGLHCYIVKISKYTHLHEINIFDEKNDFRQLKQENLKHTCLKHIIFNIFNIISLSFSAMLFCRGSV